jgi:hypothetical protein
MCARHHPVAQPTQVQTPRGAYAPFRFLSAWFFGVRRTIRPPTRTICITRPLPAGRIAALSLCWYRLEIREAQARAEPPPAGAQPKLCRARIGGHPTPLKRAKNAFGQHRRPRRHPLASTKQEQTSSTVRKIADVSG